VRLESLTSPPSSPIIVGELDGSAVDAENLRRGNIEEADVVITSDLYLGT
jgi:hypothetical protein